MLWRVTSDTNTLVSGIITPRGAAARLIELWQGEEIQFVLCDEIIDDLIDVLGRPHIQQHYQAINAATIAASATAFQQYATIVQVQHPCPAVSRDPDDDVILACALAGGADYIVTRDEDLLDLCEYQGIAILKPEMFLNAYRAATRGPTGLPNPPPLP